MRFKERRSDNNEMITIDLSVDFILQKKLLDAIKRTTFTKRISFDWSGGVWRCRCGVKSTAPKATNKQKQPSKSMITHGQTTCLVTQYWAITESDRRFYIDSWWVMTVESTAVCLCVAAFCYCIVDNWNLVWDFRFVLLIRCFSKCSACNLNMYR